MSKRILLVQDNPDDEMLTLRALQGVRRSWFGNLVVVCAFLTDATRGMQ
jgi:hypothetical protein